MVSELLEDHHQLCMICNNTKRKMTWCKGRRKQSQVGGVKILKDFRLLIKSTTVF